nr:hypothetical protein [Tanacetum cinerariifolium]
MTEITVLANPTTATEAVPGHTIVETYKNTTPKKHAYFDAEAEAIHMLLSGVGDDIYFKVNACTISKEMWIAIERLQQGLDKESYHKLFDILKQYQNKVNDIRAKKLAGNANPLALVAAAQHYTYTYYQAPKSHKSYAPPAKPSSSTRSHAITRTKSKETAKLNTPFSESAFEEDEDNNLEQAQRDKDILVL